MAQRLEAAPLPSRVRKPRGESVALSVPAHKDYVVIIRSAVAQFGARFGCTPQETTDLRLAVNEACALLVAGSTGGAGSIECRAEARADVLRVTVSAAAGTFAPDIDGIGWNLLSALVDKLTWAQDGVTARVYLEKRPGAAHAVPTLHGADWDRGPGA